MKKTSIKATTLRTIMTITIIIAIGLTALGFYYAQDQLRTFAISVGQIIAKSEISSSSPQETKKLQDEINKRQAIVNKANSLFIPSQDFQGQVVRDLNKYASNTGMIIKDYDFNQPTAVGSKSGLANGTNLSYITITLDNPVQFKNFIQFLKLIESNLPKMQLSGISLTSPQSSNNTANVDPLIIGVYTR